MPARIFSFPPHPKAGSNVRRSGDVRFSGICAMPFGQEILSGFYCVFLTGVL